jgi:hypothetical protein
MRELAEEVFVDVAEDVLGVQAFVVERDGGERSIRPGSASSMRQRA